MSTAWMLDITIQRTKEFLLMSGGPRHSQWQQRFESEADALSEKDTIEKRAEENGEVCNVSGPYPEECDPDVPWEEPD